MNLKSTVGRTGEIVVMLCLAVLLCLIDPVGEGAGAAELLGSALLVGGKRVPLPQAGDAAWTLLSERQVELRSPVSGSAIVLDSVVAGGADDQKVSYLVVVRTNRAPAAGSFGLAEACRRTDLHGTRIASRDGSTVAICTFVTHVLTAAPADADPGWAAALAAAERSGRRLPETWLMVGVRIADADDLLDVRYYFNPESIGISAKALAGAVPTSSGALSKVTEFLGTAELPHDPRWLASGWSVDGIVGEPRRIAAVGDLMVWAEGVHPLVYAGFKGRAVDGLQLPTAWAHGPPVAASGLNGTLPGEVALWKTLSWRAIASSVDAVVSLAMTGNFGVAGAITAIGAVTKGATYYLHEKAWEWRGRASSPGDLTTELPPAGIER